MISLQCKRFKQKSKMSSSKDIELKKSNEDLKKKIQTLEESVSLVSKTDETSIVKKLREEVPSLTNEFGKFLESSKTFTILLKFHQHPHDKSSLGFEKGTTSSKSKSASDKCDFCVLQTLSPCHDIAAFCHTTITLSSLFRVTIGAAQPRTAPRVGVVTAAMRLRGVSHLELKT
ncbi:hypothetical protein JHK86_031545 [Glycine max]|nr:hypothetical protein JHK86_031545 [Glycine max]